MRFSIIIFGFIAIAFVKVMALALDEVGTYQLNAVYFCSIEATEVQHQLQCRNELDGFGFLTVLPAPGQGYLAHKQEMHR